MHEADSGLAAATPWPVRRERGIDGTISAAVADTAPVST